MIGLPIKRNHKKTPQTHQKTAPFLWVSLPARNIGGIVM
jgi:hypothetical protein